MDIKIFISVIASNRRTAIPSDNFHYHHAKKSRRRSSLLRLVSRLLDNTGLLALESPVDPLILPVAAGGAPEGVAILANAHEGIINVVHMAIVVGLMGSRITRHPTIPFADGQDRILDLAWLQSTRK